jgi:hypothetical protein
MKKISAIIIVVLVIFAFDVKAAQIRFINTTGCTFDFYSVEGYFPGSPNNIPFFSSSTGTTIPANNVATPLVYANPSLLPGFTSTYTGPYNTGQYNAVKFIGPNNEAFGLTLDPTFSQYVYTVNPTCYTGGGSLTIQRTINPITGDWTIFIF